MYFGIMKEYPGILDRVKAAFMDGIIMIILMILAKQLFQMLDEVPDLIRAIAFILIWAVYEPLSVSLTGKTLGHAANGICVKTDQNHNKNINFVSALFRFIIKFFLGWISLLVVSTNDKRRAIHDYAVGSVVLYKN